MAQDFARAFYSSNAWRRTRNAYRKSVGGLCELCLTRGIIRAADVVHHKTPLTADNINNPAITSGFDNLEALCADCHRERHPEEHARAAEIMRKRFGKRWKVDEAGRVAPL